MEKLLATLNLYLDAELGIDSEESTDIDQPLFIDQPEVAENGFSIDLEDDISQDT